MKRSEMEYKLTNLLRSLDYDTKYLDPYPSHEHRITQYSKCILNLLEKNGMLPPPNPTGTFDNTWEKE